MDTVTQFYPYRCAVSRQILSGHLPLWTSSLYAGMPLLANPQVAVFYPPNWFFFLWPRAGVFTFLFAVHIYLAGLGVYFWLRARRFSHHAAIGASLLAEVNGAVWAHLAFGAYLPGMALFPWMLFSLEQYRRMRRGKWFIAMSLCGGMQIFSGAPQLVYYAFFIYIVLTVINLVWTGFKKKEWIDLIVLIICLLLGAGIGAIQIYPTRELTANSQRTGNLPMDVIRMGSLSCARVVQSLLGTSDMPQDAGDAAYMGAAGVLFLLLGMMGSWKGGRLKDFILFLVFLTLGIWPFSFVYAKILPGYGGFHDPRRILALAPFICSPLVARGLEMIFMRKKIINPGRVLFVFLSSLSVFFLWRGGRRDILLWPALGWAPNLTLGTSIALSFILFVAILIVDLFIRKKDLLWKSLIVLLAALEILNFSFCRIDTKCASEKRIRPRMVEAFKTDPVGNHVPRIIAFDKTNHYSYYYTRENFADTWLPNLAAIHGVSDLQGYDPLKPVRYHIFLSILNEPLRALYPSHFGIVRHLYSPLLERAGVTHAVGLDDNVSPEKWKKIPVPENPKLNLFAHAASPTRFVFETKPEIARNLQEAAEALRLQALSETVRGVVEGGIALSDDGGEARALIRIKDLREGYARLEVEAPRAGYLFFREAWFPGWEAFVDGKETQNHPADVMFQAALLEKGKHEVVWRYSPSSLMKGSWGTLLSFLLLFLSLPVLKRFHKIS